jgi:hypothetical protein
MVTNFGVDFFDEVAFLRFLGNSVSPRLDKKMYSYGPFNIDKSLKVDSFLEPLRSGRFPTEHLKEYRWFLHEIVSDWRETTNPYDTVYLCSFYLFSLLRLNASAGDLIPRATGRMVEACEKDQALRDHCVQYLRWLIRATLDVELRDQSLFIFLLIACITIEGFSLRTHAQVAKDMFETEKVMVPEMNNVLYPVIDADRDLWSGIAARICGSSGSLEEASKILRTLLTEN